MVLLRESCVPLKNVQTAARQYGSVLAGFLRRKCSRSLYNILTLLPSSRGEGCCFSLMDSGQHNTVALRLIILKAPPLWLVW